MMCLYVLFVDLREQFMPESSLTLSYFFVGLKDITKKTNPCVRKEE